MIYHIIYDLDIKDELDHLGNVFFENYDIILFSGYANIMGIEKKRVNFTVDMYQFADIVTNLEIMGLNVDDYSIEVRPELLIDMLDVYAKIINNIRYFNFLLEDSGKWTLRDVASIVYGLLPRLLVDDDFKIDESSMKLVYEHYMKLINIKKGEQNA